MYFHVMKKTETVGCVLEDGADTRTSSTTFFVVPDTELDEFNDMAADDYGYQDYSYQVSYKEIAKIGHWELESLADALKGAHDKYVKKEVTQ